MWLRPATRRPRCGDALSTTLALAVVLGCGVGERAWSPDCDAALARLAGAPLPARGGMVDWASLHNPVLALEDRSLKDPAIVHRDGDGSFFLFASVRRERGDSASGTRTPELFRSRDLRHWRSFSDPDLAGELGSPDVVRMGETWWMVFQRPGRGGGDARVLMLTTSRDLEDWSPPRPLAGAVLDPSERNIDGALARAGRWLVLGWKRDQSLWLTRTPDPSAESGWEAPRRADGILRFGPSSLSHDWAENYQFLEIDGAWYMLATARAAGLPVSRHVYTGSHAPFLYAMDGSGERLEDWTRWRCKRPLEIPHEAWNPAMHANSAYLADWRRHDGWFYLFYAGSADHDSFDGRGHGAIGVARSRDLVHWRVAGDARG